MTERNTRISYSQIASVRPEDLDATVLLGSAMDGYIPSFDLATGKFTWVVNQSGAFNLSELNDIEFLSGEPEDSDILIFDSVSGKWKAETIVATDEKAKVSSNDTTAGYLNGKLVQGDGITLTENNNGGDETLSVINADRGSVAVGTHEGTYVHGDIALNTSARHTQNTDSKIIVGDTSVEIVDAGDGYIIFKEDSAEIMRITGGNVGIGVSSPEGKLHLATNVDTHCIQLLDCYSDGTAMPYIYFRRSNSDTLGTKVTTVSGQYLAGIIFYGVDSGNNFDYGANIMAIQEGDAGVNIPTKLKFSTYSSTGINAHQFVLYPNGNVGIGIDPPTARLHIVHTGTTNHGLYVIGDSLTTGKLVYFYSNSADTSARNLVEIINANASSGAVNLFLSQYALKPATQITQNADFAGVILTSLATSHGASDGGMLIVEADALTTGGVALFRSSSADASTRSMVKIRQTSALATGTTTLLIRNDAGMGLDIDINGDATGLRIVSTATTANDVSLQSGETTGNTLRIQADALTSGKAIYVTSNSANTTGRQLVRIENQNSASTNASCMFLVQSSLTSHTLEIAHSSNSGRGISLIGSSLTTGSLIYAYSDSAQTNTRYLAQIINDNVLANQVTTLYVKNDGQGNTATTALWLLGNIDLGYGIYSNFASMTTGTNLYVRGDGLTTGRLAYFYSNSADTSARNLVEIINDNSAAVGTICLKLQNDSTKGAIQIVDGNQDTGKVLTSDANGLGTWQTLSAAKSASGSYSGDDTANKAIAHGLGVTPKLIIIINSTSTTWRILTGIARIVNTDGTTGYPVTAMDATNFYVGNADNYPNSANSDGVAYYWVAIA